MPCCTKLSSNKNAKRDLTLTPDKLDYYTKWVVFNGLVSTLRISTATPPRPWYPLHMNSCFVLINTKRDVKFTVAGVNSTNEKIKY